MIWRRSGAACFSGPTTQKRNCGSRPFSAITHHDLTHGLPPISDIEPSRPVIQGSLLPSGSIRRTCCHPDL